MGKLEMVIQSLDTGNANMQGSARAEKSLAARSRTSDVGQLLNGNWLDLNRPQTLIVSN